MSLVELEIKHVFTIGAMSLYRDKILELASEDLEFLVMEIESTVIFSFFFNEQMLHC